MKKITQVVEIKLLTPQLKVWTNQRNRAFIQSFRKSVLSAAQYGPRHAFVVRYSMGN